MPVINYPGNIQGRHFNELGEKGCLLIEGDHLNLTTQFYPTQFIKFEEATIDTNHTSKQELYEDIQSFKDKVRPEGKAFYRLNVRVNSEDFIAPQDLVQVKEMITEYEENSNLFLCIEDLNI